jgi:glycosyltransferase involved in cell wall biosynthesis
VRFTGWLEAVEVDRLLRAATVGIQPDPPSAMADLSTMAKSVEYLARGVPVVAANLRETRFSAGEAGIYVATGAADEFAKALDALLDDESTLVAMRAAAVERFRTVLAWEHQARAYVDAWNTLVRPRRGSMRLVQPTGSTHDRLAPAGGRATLSSSPGADSALDSPV